MATRSASRPRPRRFQLPSHPALTAASSGWSLAPSRPPGRTPGAERSATPIPRSSWTAGTSSLFSVKSYDADAFPVPAGRRSRPARNIISAYISESPTTASLGGAPSPTRPPDTGPVVHQLTSSLAHPAALHGAHAGPPHQQYAVANSGTTSWPSPSLRRPWRDGSPSTAPRERRRRKQVVSSPTGRLLPQLRRRAPPASASKSHLTTMVGRPGVPSAITGTADPRNNASIVRAYPGLRALASRLLRTPTPPAPTPTAPFVSPDDGFTWNDGKVFETADGLDAAPPR